MHVARPKKAGLISRGLPHLSWGPVIIVRTGLSRTGVFALLGSLLLTACAIPPKTISDASNYLRIGVLPAYAPEVLKRTPPNWGSGEKLERFNLDLGINALVMDRVTKALGQSSSRQVVDLQAFAPAYVATPKIHSSGERKIIGDSRPMMTEVVRSMVGSQEVDAYMVIEGGPVRIYQPQQVPAVALVKPPDPPDLSIQLSIYIIDGRTFEVAAAQHVSVVQRSVSVSWFQEPMQHGDEMKAVLGTLLDKNLEPALRQLGLI